VDSRHDQPFRDLADEFARQGVSADGPEFKRAWALLLGHLLREADSVEGKEALPGGALVYKGALALHYVMDALAALPETRNAGTSLVQLQGAIANAARGSKGPLVIKGRMRKGARPMSAQGLFKKSLAAAAVEILLRADRKSRPPTQEETSAAHRTIAELFGRAGVRGTRGGDLTQQTVGNWHFDGIAGDGVERDTVRDLLQAASASDRPSSDHVDAFARMAAATEKIT
jgi:hypothetical protein